jgi:hypothetical protein
MPENMTPQEWADMSANALAERNREVLLEMIKEITAATEKVDVKREKTHWRRVFAAAAIQNGLGAPDVRNLCVRAMYVADEMIDLLWEEG